MLTTLKDVTLNLVHNRPRSLRYIDIAEATGLSADWIRQFAIGKFDDPGVCRVETLYTFLSSRKLKL